MIILCFDLHSKLKDLLLASISEPEQQLNMEDPFAFHVTIVEKVIAIFDNVFRSWQNHIRTLEQV
jgi:hypothetical protein